MSGNELIAQLPQDELSFLDALRNIPAFEGLTEEQLSWFAQNSEDVRSPAGDLIIHQGDPADYLFVMLEGEIQGRREDGGTDAPVFTASAGQVTGMLPFSRMSTFTISARAVLPTRVARLHKSKFDEMLQRIPQLLPRLVYLLADRIREVSRIDQQREKLMALGKLSAGLAHELNNPASAARRAAEMLRRSTKEQRILWAKLEACGCSQAELQQLADLEDRVVDCMSSLPVLDSLAQSDLQDEMANWLEDHSIRNHAIDPAVLVEAGVDAQMLDSLLGAFQGGALSDAIARLATAIAVEKLALEIESSAGRISELVRAVKEYSYMDQMPEKEIDIHRGIENTLTMLKFRLKQGIHVVRQYDTDVPRIFAHGGELNQVWTNLIENAIDAMNGKGELTIRTSRELDGVLVEVIDNGPGIPAELQSRIFEPFFTTKELGNGTGLGLDTVYRIVHNNLGSISFTSKASETRFQIRFWPQAKHALK